MQVAGGLFVVNEMVNGGVGATDGTSVTMSDGNGTELHGLGIEGEQTVGEQFTHAGEILQRLDSQLKAERSAYSHATNQGELAAVVAGVEHEGVTLKPAAGDCPNPLFAPAAIREPLRSQELKDFRLLSLPQVYEYDLETVPGQTYRFASE